MSTLLLRLAGPMQSWGTQSRFTIRDTGLEPSKSGVIGLLCAALGWPRERDIGDLAALRMAVRVDHEGIMKMDYHTAGGSHRVGEKYGVAKADGSRPDTVTSRRYYLADADFLVGLEGEDDGLLGKIQEALAAPRWQLFLGRKSFVPSVSVHIDDGLKHGVSLKEALTAEKWPLASPWLLKEHCPEKLRLIVELRGGEEVQISNPVEVRHDQPFGPAFQDRSFRPRRVTTEFKCLGEEVPIMEV